MPLTNEQREAIAGFRAYLDSTSLQLGSSESVQERARSPDPAHIPKDLTIRVEIAPPTSHPLPPLDSSVLKAPERVPVYFYTLYGDEAEPTVTDTHLILFIHGGGNVVGHPVLEQNIHFCIEILRAAAAYSGNPSKCVIAAPSYRLATVPENTFPAALQDVVTAYDHVLGKGYKPSNITFVGDSAGGNCAIVLTHLALQSNRPLPRRIVPIAPSSIQIYDQLSEQAKANADTDILSLQRVEEFSNAYVANTGIARTDPLVSGCYLPFTASWPETLILVGTGDLLIDSSRELKERLVAAGVQVELVEYDEVPHGWWVTSQVFPKEFKDTVRRIGQFALGSPAAQP